MVAAALLSLWAGISALSFTPPEPSTLVSDPPIHSVDANSSDNKNGPLVDVERLAKLPLFGPVVPDLLATDLMKQLPETTLQLKLAGLFQETDQAHSRALIAEAGKEASTYRVGDALPGGAALQAIGKRFVVIKRADQLEKLEFPTLTLTDSSKSAGNIQTAIAEQPAGEAAHTSATAIARQPVYGDLQERLATLRGR
jgi:type II secretory pathway component PulC